MDPRSLARAHREVQLRLQSVSAAAVGPTNPVRRLVSQGPCAAHGRGSHHVSADPVWRTWTREAVVEEVSSVPDLRAEWEWRTAEERAGFAAFGALDHTVTHPVMGEIPCSQFLGMRVGDALLHAWDLARAIGTDDQLPPDLVVEVWTGMSPMAGFIGKSGFSGRDRAAKSAKAHRCRIGFSTFPDVAPKSSGHPQRWASSVEAPRIATDPTVSSSVAMV